MRRFDNIRTFPSLIGTPLSIEWPIDKDDPESGTEKVDLRAEHIMGVILGNCPMKTMDDAIQGSRLWQALQDCKGFVEIDVGTHNWLKARSEEVCPVIWRLNAVTINEFIKDGFEKENQPKED